MRRLAASAETREFMKKGFWSTLTGKLSGQRSPVDAELVARYAAIVESSDDAIISKDLSGIINAWNPAAERLFGYPAEEALGQSVLMLIPETLRNEETHILEQIRQGQKVRHFETQRRCKDGQLVDVSISVSPVRDARGRVVGASKIARDIGEHKAIEVARQIETELREELRRVTEMVPGVMFSYRLRPDGTSHCPYISQHVEDLYGVTPAKAAENALFMIDRIHPDDRDETLASVEASARAMSVWHAEFRILHPQRGLVWIEAMSAPTAEPDGSVIWHGFLHDITQRKQTEHSLRLSQFTLESASEAVYWIRPDSSFFYCNEAASRMLGYDKEELLRLSVIDLDGDCDRDYWKKHFAQLKAHGHMLLERQHRARDGRLIPVEVSVHYIQFEGEEYDCAIVRDISERQAVQAQLRQRMQLLESAQAAAQLGYYVTDLEKGRWVGSPMLNDIMGIDEAFDHTVENWSLLVHPDERHQAYREYQHAVQHQELLHHEYRIVRPRDGNTIWVDARGMFEYESGRPVRLIGTVMDITERKRRELELRQARDAAEAASIAKTQFLAHMSHEIRTPMNGVLGMAQLLERESLTPDQRDMVSHIRASGKSLLSILNDILDLSKIEAGELTIERQPFDLNQSLAHIDSICRVAAGAKDIDLQLHVAPGLAGHWQGDALRLEQVLFNLVGNAIKFTEQGKVVIVARPMTLAGAASRVRFEVTDTGIGIDPDCQSRLFAPFTQGDASMSRRFGGTGLGLAISKRLVEMMGGEIGVESSLGVGSTFWFELPLAPVATTVEPGPAAAAVDAAPRLQGLRVLVVDDSLINLKLAERVLQREGAEVTLRKNGQEAVDCLRDNPDVYDLVLMDIQMPVMDGLTATRAIRQELKLEHLPVIALSAGVLAEERQNAADAGINDFLPKPMDLNQMAEMIRLYFPSKMRE